MKRHINKEEFAEFNPSGNCKNSHSIVLDEVIYIICVCVRFIDNFIFLSINRNAFFNEHYWKSLSFNCLENFRVAGFSVFSKNCQSV